jgi:hypothetical protein
MIFRAIGQWTSAYVPLHENLGGLARKVVLTEGVDDAVEEDGVNGENSATADKGVPKSAP